MTKNIHRIYISILAAIILISLFFLFYRGMSYYKISLEERFYHPDHNLLKPSGILGHGLGIIGSLLIITGVGSYMARKRYRILSRMGLLKHWLEFHIFLCTLGPVMILFHTSYKFGGLVAISFWSMVAVFISGIIGRFIYIQIPRTIEGRVLSLNEVRGMKSNLAGLIKDTFKMNEESYNIIVDSVKKKPEVYQNNVIVRFIRRYINDHRTVHSVRKVLKINKLPEKEYKQVINLVKNDISINRKIEQLDSMQNLFKYWHVAHLPFALVMLIIMLIHVAVTIIFGYRWIF